MKKNRDETKKKKQRVEETFSQVIHNRESISFFALLGCHVSTKCNGSDIIDNSRVRTNISKFPDYTFLHPFIFFKSFSLKSFAES